MKFNLDTQYPVAVDSPDHFQPRCTRFDNTINQRFNDHLSGLFNDKPSVLDLGCAGGGMVRSLIDDGFEAIGLEGSDYSRNAGRAEWGVIPDNLFTCDLGHPFTLSNGDGKPYQFDVITAWEFLEHIPTNCIFTLIDNISNHVRPGGYVIGSTNNLRSIYEGIEHHLTKRPMSWWNYLFMAHNFAVRTDLEEYFDVNEAWLRVVEYGFVYSKRNESNTWL